MGKRGLKKFEINMYTPLYSKWITNKNLLYSTGNSAQSYNITWMGEGLGKISSVQSLSRV